jgi:hypothetical protein
MYIHNNMYVYTQCIMIILPWHLTTGLDASASISHARRRSALAWGMLYTVYPENIEELPM